MAKETHSGRRQRPWWEAERKRLVPVDGYMIRNFNPDFDIIEEHSPNPLPGMPYVAKGDIWYDVRFEGELPFLLKVRWFERRCLESGELTRRRWLNERLAEKVGRMPTREDLKAITVRTKRKRKLLIRYVRGDLVRRWWDVWFIFGGHDLVYPDYVPEDEVWIDIRQDPREVKFTLHHELHERKNMSKGMRYPTAHRLATASEQKLRSKELPVKRNKNRLVKSDNEPPFFFQKDGVGCGTTSLKSVLWHHGKRLSRKRIDRICGLTEDGIDHEPLAVGATRIGANAFMKDEGTLSELRFFLEQGYPVIVGWWSYDEEEEAEGYGPFDPKWNLEEREEWDCGHYSVLFHMSEHYVWLMDPQLFTLHDGTTVKGGERRMSIAEFLERWNDTDGSDYKPVQRWYLVVNFDGKTFAGRFKGGKDYLPEGRG